MAWAASGLGAVTPTEELLVQVLEEVRATRLLIEARAEGPLATDADVDDQYGDPAVKFDPKGWRGPAHKGLKMSACAPEFLDAYARTLDVMAKKDDEKKRLYKGRPASRYSRIDAARARRWAYRIRCGYVSTARSEAEKAAAEAPAAKPNPFAKPAPAPVEPPPNAGDAWLPPEPPESYASESERDDEPIEDLDDRF